MTGAMRVLSKKLMEEDVLRKMIKPTIIVEKNADKKRTESSHVTVLMTLLRSVSVEQSGYKPDYKDCRVNGEVMKWKQCMLNCSKTCL